MSDFRPSVRYLLFTDRDANTWRVYQFNRRQSFHAPRGHFVSFGSTHGGEVRGFVPETESRRPRRLYEMRHHEREADSPTDQQTLQRQLDQSVIDPRDG